MAMSDPFYSKDGIQLRCDDVLTLDDIPEASVDLIVTSPPYNVDIKYGEHDDTMEYACYLEFSRKWLSRCYDWLKSDGRMCLNIPLDKNKGGQHSVYTDLAGIARSLGYRYQSTIIWNEQNISRRTAWGSWLSASAPFVIAPVEVIVVLYRNTWKKTSGSRVSDIEKQDFLDWTNGVWNFNGESKKRIGHPAPFPIELPRRCIKLFSYVDDLVLDPFSGSGTTMLACAETRRRGLGIDVDSTTAHWPAAVSRRCRPVPTCQRSWPEAQDGEAGHPPTPPVTRWRMAAQPGFASGLQNR